MSVNGQSYDWECVEVQLPSGVAVGITDINYGDERGIEVQYGKGGKPRAYGRKNYKATASMVLDADEAERLRKALGGSFYKGDPFTIVCSYADDGVETLTDTLPSVKITKNATSAKQDDAKVGAKKLDLVILKPIKWNGESAV